MEKNFDLQKLTPQKTSFSSTTCATPIVLASMSDDIRADSESTDFATKFFDRDLLEGYGIQVNESPHGCSYAHNKMHELGFPWKSILSPHILLPEMIQYDKNMSQALSLGLEEQNNRLRKGETKTEVTIRFVAPNTPIDLPTVEGPHKFTDQLSASDTGLFLTELISFPLRSPEEGDVQAAALSFSKAFLGAASGPNNTLHTPFFRPKKGAPNSFVVKPDVAAGYLFLNNKEAVTAQSDLPQLRRAAEMLHQLKDLDCVLGTRLIFLPCVLGEFKGSNPNARSRTIADGYKLFYQMAASYNTHEVFWVKPPPFVFGLHHADSRWHLFAMGEDREPIEFATIPVHNIVDYVYFLTVCRRLGKYIEGTLELLEVDESEVQAIIERYQAIKEAKEQQKRKKSRRHTEKSQSTRTSHAKAASDKSSRQCKGRGHSGVPVKGHTVKRVNGLTFAIKIEHPKRISRELYCFDKLKDCLYVPRVLGSGMINDREAFLRLPYLQQLPMPKNAAQFRKICRQIVAALRAVHKQGLVHCDIKDDNIMWDQATDTVQLIDFEFAIELKDGCTFGLNYGGTSLFMSPELLAYKKDPTHSTATNKSDVFSAGLVLAGLMYGVRIRSGEQRQLVLRKLRKREVSAVGDEQAVNLLLAMTSAEDRRPSAEDCLKHPFLAGKVIQRASSVNTPRLNNSAASNCSLGRSIRH